MSRLSFGYKSVTADNMEAITLLETSPDLADRLKRVQTAVSGIGSGFSGSPMFALGMAFDLDAGRSLVSWVADEIGRVGDACGARELSAGAADLKESVGQPIPPPLATLRGAALVLQDAVMGESGPSGVEGYAVLGIDNPAALISIAKNFVPGLAELEVAGDGSFRPLPSGLTAGFPGKVALAAKSDALIVAAGKGGQTRAEEALANKPSTSPLLVMSYDYGKLMELVASDADPEVLEMLEGVTSAIGTMTVAMSPSDRGLVLDGEVELK